MPFATIPVAELYCQKLGADVIPSSVPQPRTPLTVSRAVQLAKLDDAKFIVFPVWPRSKLPDVPPPIESVLPIAD